MGTIDTQETLPARMRFSDTDGWMYSGVDFFHGRTIRIGDPVTGPTIALFASDAGAFPPKFPAHGHASDSFRITVLGNAPTGEFDYYEGEFRLQEGWKPYGGDNLARGTEGGWQFLMFADRRGARVRLVKADDPDPGGGEGSSKFLQIDRGDIFSPEDERFAEPGPSALASTLVKERPKHAYINGSFTKKDSWLTTSGGNKAAGVLMGHVDNGPLVLLISASEGTPVSFGSKPLGAEVVELIVSGSATIDGDTLKPGDLANTAADEACPELVAGSGGLDLVVVFGERRAAKNVDPAGGEFAALVEPLVRDLEGSLLISA